MTATAKQKIDWTKPVQARRRHTEAEWRNIEVLRTDIKSPWPVLFIIVLEDGSQAQITCTHDGEGCHFEFRNTPAPPVPFEVKRWFNIYRSGGMFLIDSYYDTEECARSRARRNSLETVTVPVTIRGEWKQDT